MKDIYQEVTNKILNQMENGIIPWHKPWAGITGGAYNRISKPPYSILNQMLLQHDGEYATYKQWKDLGGKIRKGETSEIVVFWKMIPVEDTKSDGTVIRKTVPMLRYFNVFHISQVDGVEPVSHDIKEHDPIKEAEEIIDVYDRREAVTMEDVPGDEAFYSPARDYLRVPVKGQYKEIAEYYSTKFHEIVHSTGHKTRLGRFNTDTIISKYGSEDYSKEELIAEIGTAMLMSKVGIDTPDTFKNSTAYIQGWLKVLKNDKKLIVSASSKAQKAVEYIINGK